MQSEGEGSGLFDDASHLAARVAAEVLGHDHFAVTVRSQIPLARGLGSSAALAAAAAAAAGAEDPFAVAAAYDGHPENAAASVFGGLVAATRSSGRPVHAALPLSDELAFVVIVPERNLATPEARGVLPETLTWRTWCSTSAAWACWWPAWPTPTRSCRRRRTTASTSRPAPPLFPEAPELLRAPRRRRGSGGQLVGCGSDAPRHRPGRRRPHPCSPGPRRPWRRRVPGRALVLQADRRGIVYGDEAEVPL